MMQKILRTSLFAALVFGAFAANAQSSKVQERFKMPAARPGTLKPALMPQALTGFETPDAISPSVPAAAPAMFRNQVEEIAGLTAYDRQSNGSEQSRVYAWPNGDVSTAWTMSLEEETLNAASSWTDRGSGYNHRNAWLGGSAPTTRLESVRTGFTNYVVTANGTEIAIAHRSPSAGQYRLRMSRRASGAATWTESDIPTAAPNGELWCKATVDGNNVYVIAITTPTGTSTGGTVYKGVDGHLLFWRSQDAGATWDIQDAIIPGIDSSAMAALAADTYALDAHEGTLAVAVFDPWNDAVIYKSLNGGSSWETPYTVINFPLKKYVTDHGYTIDEIGGVDPIAADLGLSTYAIFTSDGNISVLVDNAGFVHAWAGRMWVLDSIVTDAGKNYYPGINGLMYWNEYNPEVLSVIDGSRDLDGNGTLDIGSSFTSVAYGCNLSSMATSAVSQNDTLYVAYSGMVENLSDNAGNPLRHVFQIKSGDFGATWLDDGDVHYATNDSGLADFQEGVNPYYYKHLNADGKLHLVYSRDYTAGSAVIITTGFQPGSADIVYVAGGVTGTKEPVSKIDLSISPNPASDLAYIRINLEKSADLVLDIFNVAGERVQTQHLSAASGPTTIDLRTAGFNNGMYFARLSSAYGAGMVKMMVQH